ncbi:serine/threonine-protein kinase PknK [Sandaracinus amylolyticus]|uniref:Putative serine/threonine protein kinase n=1 Tax=Sandaracinus amylolyticus TaxID=927083 RepID=A0A0F6VZU1_9BACT|nr:serine/threonine-protein kinase [Sandaracinus amylolyticus]AKF03633.1 putative serine/threonine protein kinase [Sandaracinus amylolyticus]
MSFGRLGAYRLVEELGRGGMGTVFRARDPSGNEVAVKRIDAAVPGPGAVDRFLREASARIDHPNVVRTLGAGMDATGRPYLVLELLEGETLDVAFARGIEMDVLLDAIVQACRGLGAIHAAGLVHRDVKPANLFRCRDGALKVLDLGIATASDGSSGITASGAIVGTPAYLAPEQARGEVRIDERADVWALGVVLYEGLTRVSPFRREGTLATLLAVAVDPAPPLARVAPEVPRAIARVVERCLEKDPAGRWASARDLADALARAMVDAEEDATAPTMRARAVGGERRSIAIVLAESVVDPERFASAMTSVGGEHVPLIAGRAAGIFGAQISHGDEIERALAAARTARAYAARLAIAVGPAVLRGTVIGGEALREAEEACSRAERGVVAGPKAARAIASRCDLIEVAPELFLVGETRSTPQAASPLLARDAELAALRRARDTVIDEHRAALTWILGPPGIGKTRLAEAVRGLAAESSPPLAWRRSEAEPHEPAHALAVWQRALGVEPARGASGKHDPQAVADRLRAEVLGRARALLREGPLVIVLEDLQWADPTSLALLEEAPTLFADSPLWIVGTGRPELAEAHPELLASASASSRIEPGPLRASDVLAMARARGLRSGELTPAAAQALADHAGGNPLFIEQMLDAGGAHGLSAVEPSAWPLPATIEHAVQARLDRLPSDEKECVKRLAIFARPADVSELEGIGTEDAERLLGTLVRRELLARVTVRGARAYRFRSPLVGAVAYSMLDDDHRRELHRRAAALGEAQGREPEDVGRHLEAAGDPSRAAPWYTRAALAAAQGGDARAVLRCASHAIRCGVPDEDAFALHFARAEAARFVGDAPEQSRALDDAEASATDERERALASSERGELHRRMRRYDEALTELERAVLLAERSGDADTLARATCRRASTWVTLGRNAEASGALAALASIEPRLMAPTRAIVEDLRGYVAGTSGDHGARKLAYARAAALYAEAGDLRRASGAESNGADASNRLGAHEEAEAALRRALDLARRVGNRLTEGYALANLGYALGALGRGADAVVALDGAITIATAIGDLHLEQAARLYALRARLHAGETQVADALEALAGQTHGDATLEANARALASRARLERGELEASLQLAGDALSIRDAVGSVEEGEGEVFLAAVRALEANGYVEEARAVRARGRARIEELAARIVDAGWRRSFLERIAEHRALVGTG